MPADSFPIIKRSRRACTACRQAKLRCDGAQLFPAPCSRCNKNSLECRIDPNFRRLHTAHNLTTVTTQLTAIQRTLRTLSSPPTSLHPYGSGSSTVLDMRSDSHREPLGSTDCDADSLNEHFLSLDSHTNSLQGACISLGSIEVQYREAQILLKHFQKYHYRHCPILVRNRSSTALYHFSPFLFWTIIVISSRFHPTLRQLYNALVAPYRQLLGRTLAEPITILESIQGLLFLCLWPLDVVRQPEDPSWNYCGLATNAAVRLGLQNDTGESRSSSNPTLELERRVRLKTWFACIKVNTIFIWRWASCLQLPLTDTAMKIPGPHTPPEADFITKLQIECRSSRTALLMSKIHSLADLSIIQHLCRELDDLKQAERSAWNGETDIELLGAQLSLYSYKLQQIAPARCSSSESIPDAVTLKGVLIRLGVETAVNIIQLFSELADMGATVSDSLSQRDPHHPTRYLPKYYYITLLFSASFIFKAMAHSEEDFQHSESVWSHIKLTHKMLSTWSWQPTDEFGRAARMIRVLSRASNLSILEDFESLDGTSVSVLDDTIHAAKEMRGSTGADSPTETPRPESEASVSNPTLPNTEEFWQTQSIDGMVGFDFNWNSPWGFDMAAIGYGEPGLATEHC